MPKSVSDYLRVKVASRVCVAKLLPKVGIDLDDESDPECAEAVYACISNKPTNLIRDCRIKTLGFDDLGPSAKYYPNHGYYRTPGDVLVLNKRMLSDPIHGMSDDGREISTFEFILAHELGHGWDAAQGQEIIGNDYSLCPEWTSLSDWSEAPRPGHKRLRIREKGYPEKVGEWYYGPEAKFSRYYGKMNPWDDWADSFAYYVTGMKNRLPEDKLNYFNERLGNYFSDEDPIDLSMNQYSPRFAFNDEDPRVKFIFEKYPDFMQALVRKSGLKELTRRGVEHGVTIPTLQEYMSGMTDKDDDILKKYLGRVPNFHSSDNVDEVLDEFSNKVQQNPSPGMSIETTKPGFFKKMFKRGSAMKIAGTLLDIADILDEKGRYLNAAEIRSISKRVAAEANEIYSISGKPVEIKSIERFIEDYKPKSNDPFIESLKAYQEYVDGLLTQHLNDFEDLQKKSKFKDILEGAKNIAGMALKDFEKPVPGKEIIDPGKSEEENKISIDKLISTADKMINIKLKQLNRL